MDTVTAQRARRRLPRTSGLSEETFTLLYQRQLKPVYNYVRYRLGAAEAEDVTAEIFARAWSRRRKFDPTRGTAETWLWAIARNRVIDWQRRRRPHRVELSPDVAASDDPAAEIGRQEEWARLQAALAELAPVDQEIVALRFGAGETNRAIATLLKMGEANVAQRLRRALRRMRTYLQGGEAG